MRTIEATYQIKKFWDDMPIGMSVACAKNDKLAPTFLKLFKDFGRQYGLGFLCETTNRQIYRLGDIEIKLIRAADAMDWLNYGGDCYFAVTTLNEIAEWGAKAGYKRVRAFLEDYEVSKLGTNFCTVEVACDSDPDLVDAYKTNGLAGIDRLARTRSYKIATDTPNIARFFFTSSLIDDTFKGSIELLPKWQYKLIVTVVETGKSLEQSRWIRLSQYGPAAILINSQSCIVRKRRKNVPQDI